VNEIFVFKLAAVFGAGFLTSISPCVYPTLPLTVGFLTYQARSSNSRRPTVLFFLGQTAAYVALGFVAVRLSEVFGFSSQSFVLNAFLALALLAMGLISFLGAMPATWVNAGQSLQKRLEAFGGAYRWAPVFIGAGAALVASPCTSPILGSVLMAVSQDPWSAKTVAEMVAYAFGASTLVLILGFGILKARELPRSGPWLVWLHKFSGLVILAAAGYYIYRACGLIGII
jgi:thiol:disulfide interchange protein DsbD